MFIVHFVLLILSTVTRAQQPLQINSAQDVETCGHTLVEYTWSGGTPPYWLTFWYFGSSWQQFSNGLLLNGSDATTYVYTYFPDNKTTLCRMQLQDSRLYGTSTYLDSNNFTVAPCVTDLSMSASPTDSMAMSMPGTSMSMAGSSMTMDGSSMSMDTTSADMPMSTSGTGLVVGALTDVYTCANLTSITYLWAGGSPPYVVSLVAAGNMNDVILMLASRTNATSFTQWVTSANLSANWTDISLEVMDSEGEMAGSQSFSILPCSDRPATHKSSNVGAIVGGVVGGIAAILIIAVAAWYLVRRRRKQKTHRGDRFVVDNNDYEPRPFHQVTSTTTTIANRPGSLGRSSSGAGVTHSVSNSNSGASGDHDDAQLANMNAFQSAASRSAGTPSLSADDTSITNRNSTMYNGTDGSTHALDSGTGLTTVDGLLPPIYEPGWQEAQAQTGGGANEKSNRPAASQHVR